MADFTRWGFAIAEAMEIGGERFLKAYENNQNKANDEVISSNPVAAAVITFMSKREQWKGSMASLLKNLEIIADKEKIGTRTNAWPKAPHVLSRRLKEIRSNLQQEGIDFDARKVGDVREIEIVKKTGKMKERRAKKEPQEIDELDLLSED